MKKSSIFKILTLILTFVIFSCCSGCIFALGLQLKENEEKRQRCVEIQKQRKAQADALIPEIDGYIFEALPQEAFINQEDWKSKGFIHQHNFFNWGKFHYYYKKQKTETSFIVTVRTNSGKVFNKIIIDIKEYEERLSKYFEIFSEYSASEESIINKDGEFFLVSWMPYKRVGMRTLAGPPALFLLDFENNTMLYVGYAKGWLEYEIEHGEIKNDSNICYKLTKK